jgi:diguanylate cyclase (GGDEF)-like protein
MFTTSSEIRSIPLNFAIHGSHIIVYNKNNQRLVGTNSDFYKYKIDLEEYENFKREIESRKIFGSDNIVAFKNSSLIETFTFYELETDEQNIISLIPFTSNIQIVKEMAEEMSLDPLTKALTREKIISILDNEIIKTKNAISLASILMIKVDDTERIAETIGSDARDLVIKSTAAAIKNTIRPTDSVGKIGEDEFAVILLSTGIIGAIVVADRILARVESLTINYEQKLLLKATVSIGITATKYADVLDSSSILAKANQALAVAVKNGRGRYEIHE